MRSPDASWVSSARIDILTEAEKKGYALVCPEFLVEILSESDSRLKLEEKMEMWTENGALLAWIIDPFAAEIIIYHPGKESERLVRPEWVEADAVVPGFRLETSRLGQIALPNRLDYWRSRLLSWIIERSSVA